MLNIKIVADYRYFSYQITKTLKQATNPEKPNIPAIFLCIAIFCIYSVFNFSNIFFLNPVKFFKILKKGTGIIS
jgi:hypothetical protein